MVYFHFQMFVKIPPRAVGCLFFNSMIHTTIDGVLYCFLGIWDALMIFKLCDDSTERTWLT